VSAAEVAEPHRLTRGVGARQRRHDLADLDPLPQRQLQLTGVERLVANPAGHRRHRHGPVRVPQGLDVIAAGVGRAELEREPVPAGRDVLEPEGPVGLHVEGPALVLLAPRQERRRLLPLLNRLSPLVLGHLRQLGLRPRRRRRLGHQVALAVGRPRRGRLGRHTPDERPAYAAEHDPGRLAGFDGEA
jgi:hypothetical protein